MSEETKKNGLVQYWPQIVAIVMVVFYIGMAYGDSRTMQQRIEGIEQTETQKSKAQDKQRTEDLKIVDDIDKRVDELEKASSYQEGYRQARKEIRAETKTHE